MLPGCHPAQGKATLSAAEQADIEATVKLHVEKFVQCSATEWEIVVRPNKKLLNSYPERQGFREANPELCRILGAVKLCLVLLVASIPIAMQVTGPATPSSSPRYSHISHF